MASSSGAFSALCGFCFFWMSWLFLSDTLHAQRPLYRSPMGPREAVQLTSLFGEIRNTHFHSGIDISIQGEEGKPVYAVSDGYVARLRVSDSGYGKCVYLQHNDGKTSVYAHLVGFEESIRRWMVAQQYARQTFVADLLLTPDLLPIRAGTLIGYAGETGRAFGPHLHFEIRDEQQNALNPLRFCLPKKVKTLPIITNLAIKTTQLESAVNGQFGFHKLAVVGRRGHYRLKKKLFIKGCVALSVEAHVPLGRQNRGGVSDFTLFINRRPVYEVSIEAVDFRTQHHVRAHAEHKLLLKENRKYTKLYSYEGNPLTYYKTDEKAGVYCFHPERKALVRIVARTHGGNTATLQFGVNETAKFLPLTAAVAHHEASVVHELLDHTLMVRTPTQASGKDLLVYVHEAAAPKKLMPAYYLDAHNVYLWNLEKSIPYRLESGGSPWNIPIYRVPKEGKKLVTEDMDLIFEPHDLYHPLYIELHKTEAEGQEFFAIGDGSIPLKSHIEVVLKPEDYYPSEKTAVYFKDPDGEREWMGGLWTGRRISFATRNLGLYTLLTDHTAPTVRVEKKHPKEGIVLHVHDDLSGVASWEATVRGNWLLMEYSSKNNILHSVAKDDDFSYVGIFEIVVDDRMGNSRSLVLNVEEE